MWCYLKQRYQESLVALCKRAFHTEETENIDEMAQRKKCWYLTIVGDRVSGTGEVRGCVCADQRRGRPNLKGLNGHGKFGNLLPVREEAIGFSSRGDMSNLGVKRFNLMAVSIIECNGQGWEEKAFAIILEKEDSDIVKTR